MVEGRRAKMPFPTRFPTSSGRSSPPRLLGFSQHLRPFKARTRASGGHRYAPRRVFLAPKYTGTATTTLHRLRRHFPNPESDAPERRCPFWADEKEGEVEKAPGAGAQAPLPPLLFFNSFYLFNLAIPSHHSTGHPFASNAAPIPSHHNSSNTRSNGHRTRAR